MEKQEQQKYQITCLLDPELDKETRTKLINKIKEKIAKKQGEIKHESCQPEDMERKRISYFINKKREAFYWEADLSIPSNAIKSLEDEFNLNKNIIRFLIVKQPQKQAIQQKEKIEKDIQLDIIDKIEPAKKAAKQDQDTKKTTEKEEKSAQEKPKQETKDSKSKIEDLDEKLDEILNQ